MCHIFKHWWQLQSKVWNFLKFSAQSKAVNERDSDGFATGLSAPDFAPQFGFKNPLILVPDTEDNDNKKNFITTFSMDGLKVSNVSWYQPQNNVPIIMSISTAFTGTVNIINSQFTDIDRYTGTSAIFLFGSYATINFENATFTNMNINAHAITPNYDYVSGAGLFYITHLTENSNANNINWVMKNVTIDNLKGVDGGAIFIDIESGVANTQYGELTFDTLVIRNSEGKESGLFLVQDGDFYIKMVGSTFESNNGIEAEADLNAKRWTDLEINSTSFLYSTTQDKNTNHGTSITIAQDQPFVFETKLNSVTLQCSSTAFDSATYISSLSSAVSGSGMDSTAPIYLGPGQLVTSSSTFKNCFTSINGGVISGLANTVSKIHMISFRFIQIQVQHFKKMLQELEEQFQYSLRQLALLAQHFIGTML